MKMDRRTFLKTMGSIGLFTIVPRNVLGGNGFIAPSDQLTKGIIGTGGIGRTSYHFTSDERCRLVALCDVDKSHLDLGKNQAMEQFGENVRTYHDFRNLINDPNVDIVHIATPPHWHAIMAVEAAKAGKDIWCEKPMTRTIGEGRRVMEAVERYKRIFRLNTWFRFQDDFYNFGTKVEPIKKLVDSGLLGWPLKFNVSNVTGFPWGLYALGHEDLEPQAIPSELDYDFWLGPAPYKPYNAHRVHGTFRSYWDYDGGVLGDMGQHYFDPIQYMLGKDDVFPVKVEVDAPQQHPDAIKMWRHITWTYEDGCQITTDWSGYEPQARMPYIEGPKGKLYPGFECTIPDIWEKLKEYPDPAPQRTDFIDCVKNRQKFALNEVNGFHSCTIVNIGVTALRLNRKELCFDPVKQIFVNDDEANALIDQPMRSPWRI